MIVGVRKIFSLARYPFTPNSAKKIMQIYAADNLANPACHARFPA
jgi:hypothetical protein